MHVATDWYMPVTGVSMPGKHPKPCYRHHACYRTVQTGCNSGNSHVSLHMNLSVRCFLFFVVVVVVFVFF